MPPAPSPRSTGAPPGHWAAPGRPRGPPRVPGEGRREREVGPEQLGRLHGTPNLAGSALTPSEGVRRAADMLDCDWQDVWPKFSRAPARFMGLEEGFSVGAAANFALIETDTANRIVSHSLRTLH